VAVVAATLAALGALLPVPGAAGGGGGGGPARITAAGVGDVRLGATFRALRRDGLVGRLRPGCELQGPDARAAALRGPVRGFVDFTETSPRRAASISVRGGATARGVGVGATRRAVRRAFPRVRFRQVLGFTIGRVPRGGGGRLEFALDRQTGRVVTIGVPFVAFCE
jgi:hypothetical protein